MATTPTRKLAAILVADVVGYSRLMRADETGTLTAMKELWGKVVQPSVRAHRGRVFKLMGDGVLAEFASVVDAANAAEAIQTAANERASDQAEDKSIRLRIGINLGDVVVDGSDLYGDGVNIAARLQEVAPVGGIAVSATTYEYLQGKTEFVFADAGERSLKNIDQPIQVWLWPAAGEATPQAVTTPNRSSQPSIAVLPFKNLSSDADAEFFADGMTEDVINAVSKFRWLFVIAGGTMFTYKGKSVATAQVATELGVRYVVEGSVRQAGQRMRISVQLVDTETGNPLWTERFDRQLDDIFAIQDEITNAIAGAIAPEIERFEQRRADAAFRTDIDVWLLYQKGQSAANERSEEKLVEAIQIFDQVEELDPKFVPALAMGAINRVILGDIYRASEVENLRKHAKEKAELASSIDPSDPLVMLAHSRIHSGLGNHSQAMVLARKAVDVNPNNAFAHARMASAALISGEFDECQHHCGIVLALSPFDPFEAVAKSYMAFCLYQKKEYEQALNVFRSSSNPKRMNIIHRSIESLILKKLGDIEAANISISEIKSDFPQVSYSRASAGVQRTAHSVRVVFLEALRELNVLEE